MEKETTSQQFGIEVMENFRFMLMENYIKRQIKPFQLTQVFQK